MKTCSKCGIKKEIKEFIKGVCKTCQAAYHSKWLEKNKEEVVEYKKQYYESHKEERLAYLEEHKEEIAEYKRLYQNKRLKKDINYKLKLNIRSRIRLAIKNGQKVGSAIADLGCSVNFLIGYLGAQFYDNPYTGEKMSWDNYGLYGWHLDHIIPLCNFNLEDRQEFLKANHFSNLQPLWAKDNLRKNNSLITK